MMNGPVWIKRLGFPLDSRWALLIQVRPLSKIDNIIWTLLHGSSLLAHFSLCLFYGLCTHCYLALWFPWHIN
jgi:hypothetical protein